MIKTKPHPVAEKPGHVPRLAIFHGPQFQAHFTRTSHFTRAILDGHPNCFGDGRTENEALGDMLRNHAERFGWRIVSGKKT